jgi:uncharacterized protein (UPF0548 family)
VLLREVEPTAFDDAPLTYPEVGATRRRRAPGGYRSVERIARIGTGPGDFARAAAALLGWRMHRRAGVRVTATEPEAVPEAIVLQRIGIGRAGLLAPCRVVYTVDGPDQRGFAYGTLPGHPVHGEEAFLVDLDDDGAVYLTVRAFSRPAGLAARVAGPAGELVQDAILIRYRRALVALTR